MDPAIDPGISFPPCAVLTGLAHTPWGVNKPVHFAVLGENGRCRRFWCIRPGRPHDPTGATSPTRSRRPPQSKMVTPGVWHHCRPWGQDGSRRGSTKAVIRHIDRAHQCVAVVRGSSRAVARSLTRASRSCSSEATSKEVVVKPTAVTTVLHRVRSQHRFVAAGAAAVLCLALVPTAGQAEAPTLTHGEASKVTLG